MAKPPQIPIRRPMAYTKAGAQLASKVAQLFKEGLALHQQGHHARANAIYEQILAKHPKHFDALHLAGVIALQNRNLALAVELIGKAIEINPNQASTYYNLGNALKEARRFEEAVARYYKAIELRPGDADAYYNCGNALLELRRPDEAIVSYDRVIKIKPDHADAYYNRGNALLKLKRPDEAVASYDRAIEIKLDYADAYSNRGLALKELKRPQEAVASYDRAIEIKPDYAQAYSNRGLALQDLKRFKEAVASYDMAIEIKPDYADAYSNRGVTLVGLRRPQEAVASYDRALEIEPHHAQAYSNRGLALQEINRIEEAVVSFERAIEIKPDYADAHWNKALALLLLGEFSLGWELYEWRLKTEKLKILTRNFPEPLWLGNEDLTGKTILLHAEQGLGDTIQFCRYAKLVKASGAKVVLEVPKALFSLLSGLEGVDWMIEKGQALPTFECHCPLMSLPLAFKTDLASVPSAKPYLASTPKKRQEWGQRLGAKVRRRVGLVWSGNAVHENDHNRSLPLQQLLPHLPDCFDYVSLQKEVRELDMQVLEGSCIRHYAHELEDFADTAALCDLMDGVISVDTSVAHLAGALGKPTCVLLPFAPDWRWLLERDTTPWYESLVLYRQAEDRSWEAVLERMSKDIQRLVE